ncbi:GFA family protein [Herbaspirillum robiniae]|uniref:GFA family protein n=1 Tax=Herbaspirillum robiniae TaxID=2014887 RepID=UPI003D778095
MKLEGSCHCGAVSFSLESDSPYPYQRCYCSICRKTQGGGGYAINLGGDYRTLKVHGRKAISIYHARMKEPGAQRAHRSTAQRHFCSKCGSALWLYSPEWPDLVHPFASAIDTPLPAPPEHTHLLLDSKAPWVEVEGKKKDKKFQHFPKESLLEWHQRLGFAPRTQEE